MGRVNAGRRGGRSRSLRPAAALALACAVGAAHGASVSGIGPAGAAGTGDVPLKVVVGIVPQAYFVERIGGDRVRIEILVPPGQSPHVFEPTPRQMAALSEARVYFAIGLPFERALLERLRRLNTGLWIVDTTEGITRLPLAEERGAAPAGGHDHGAGEPDPHVWMSPRLVKLQAGTICDGLAAVDPAGGGTYRENLERFLADLDTLDAHVERLLAPLHGRGFLVFHPAFGYFAAAYGLRQVPIEVAGKEPGPRELAAIIDRARLEGARVILVEPQFSDRTARAVAAEIGGDVVSVDPLAWDYLANIRRLAEEIPKALGR